MKLNIRNKLIIFAVLAIIIPLGISALIILVQLTSFTQQRSTERIKSDARVAKSVFDKRQENIRAAARECPLDRILIETDSPYLAPIPHRGKRNEPAYVVETAKKIAEVRGVPIDEIARATTANFKRFFQLGN